MSKEDKTEDGYGIAYLASELEMSPQNVRNALRRLGVEKTDNRYSWSRKSEADAVVKRIETETKAGKGAKGEKAAKEEKSSKKSVVNKDAADRGKKSAKEAKEAKGAKTGKADKPGKGKKADKDE